MQNILLFLRKFSEPLRRIVLRMGEAADHVVVFKDPFQQMGQGAHQTVAPASLRTLLVGSRGDTDVDGFLRPASMLDLDLPYPRILRTEEADGCDEVRVLDLLHPFRESCSCVV